MVDFRQFEQNLQALRGRVAAAAAACGRDPKDVKILPVTKTHPVDAVVFAARAGFASVGENKVQEAVQKMAQAESTTASGMHWELIGHLQSNKAKKAVEHFDRIQSLDSVKLADKIDFEAKKIGKIQRVLLQVNSGRDPAKFGAEIEEAEPLLEAVLSKQNIAVEGLMAIAPLDEDPDSARRAFDTLRTMRDDFQARFGVSLPELSMGMTSDLECAIEAGSTMIRVGTFLYGQRFYPEK